MDPDRRRSLIVQVTTLSLAGAFMAGPLLPAGKEFRRNIYQDQESCERDYSPSQCEPQHSGGGAGGGGGWIGPRYYGDRSEPGAKSDPGPGRLGLATRVETSIRGGFGRVGRFLHVAG
jgi:hypothetical protein